jgi:hypothetical protein
MSKMVTREHQQPADTVEYFSEDGKALGAITSYRRLSRTRHVVEVNDWDSDAQGYDPLIVLVTEDWHEAVATVRERWEEHLSATGATATAAKGLPNIFH